MFVVSLVFTLEKASAEYTETVLFGRGLLVVSYTLAQGPLNPKSPHDPYTEESGTLLYTTLVFK